MRRRLTFCVEQKLQPKYMVAAIIAVALALKAPEIADFETHRWQGFETHTEVQPVLLESVWRAFTSAGEIETGGILSHKVAAFVTNGMGYVRQIA
jgi:hypothetical protein